MKTMWTFLTLRRWRRFHRSLAGAFLKLFLLTFSALCCAHQAQAAATLYGATASASPGELYILNPGTGGVIQDVGALNDVTGANYGVTGLAFNPFTGLLYGSTAQHSAVPAQLISINPLTAQVTVIGAFNVGNTGTPSTMSDLAFDPRTGRLYGIGSVGGPQLYLINPITGQATFIGNSGLTSTGGGGLAISPSGVFYGTPDFTLFGTYNPTTGAYSNITNPAKPAGGGSYAALAFNDAGVLFGLNSGPGSPPPTHLVTINPSTGAVTDLGASVNSLDAIAFSVVVPEPTTGTLLVALMTV